MSDPLADFAIETISGPTDEPVSLAMAKAQCRVEHDADNLLLLGDDKTPGWIKAARDMVERSTGLRLMPQTVEITLAGFPDCGFPIQLPVAPVISVTGVSYRDGDGVTQTLTGYGTWLAKRPSLIGAPAGGWPTASCDGMAAVTITAVVGFANGLPAQAAQAMLLCLGYWNSFRGDGKDPAAVAAIPGEAGLPAGALRLIGQLRRREYR